MKNQENPEEKRICEKTIPEQLSAQEHVLEANERPKLREQSVSNKELLDQLLNGGW